MHNTRLNKLIFCNTNIELEWSYNIMSSRIKRKKVKIIMDIHMYWIKVNNKIIRESRKIK